MGDNEFMWRYHTKEEEFLDEYGSEAIAASKFLGDDWSPDLHCDDRARHNRAYFLSSGEAVALSFNGAAVFREGQAFWSVQIVLRSSKREVTVRVREVEDGKLAAEKIVDRLPKGAS